MLLSFPNRAVKFEIVVMTCTAAGNELSEVKSSSRVGLKNATPRSFSTGKAAFTADDIKSLRSVRSEVFIVSIVSSVTCCFPLLIKPSESSHP